MSFNSIDEKDAMVDIKNDIEKGEEEKIFENKSRLDNDLIDVISNNKILNELTTNDNPFLNNIGIIKNSKFKQLDIPQNITNRDRMRALAKKKCEICNSSIVNGLGGKN